GRPDCPTKAPPPLPAGQTRTVTVETTQGTIVLRIDGSLGPNAAGNFVALAECGFYDGVVFHRLVPGFVIQGGDPDGNGTGGPGYTIQDQEVKGEYKRGTLAMARTSAPNSQNSQFFIVLTDDPAGPILESYRTYAIFGEVSDGMEVVDAIAAMPNSGDATGNQALEPVPMAKLTVSSP
ncbi:MAG: peptidylprolyl isomerase, partial [Chloroflexi bacterium]|nr:peptidylprolyl isomerase [Chloroflexota bacterium]